MHQKIATTTALVITGLLAGNSLAAVINVPDHSFTPDGSGTVSTRDTNIEALNGSPVLSSSGSTAYVVSTFEFGAGSDAHLQWQFFASTPPTAGRIGLNMQDNGSVSIPGIAPQRLDFDGMTDVLSPSSFSFAQDMAGETVVMIAKLHFDTSNSDTYNVKFNNGPRTPHGGADTLMNVWFNPTAASVEGAGPAAGDLYAIWNSSTFRHMRTSVFNQNTSANAGDSSVLNTVILTGDDATFANALAAAGVSTIPSPSAVFAGIPALGALLMRRRRN